MAGSRFVNPYAQSVQSTGLPYPGGQLFFYLSGTSTPSPTYSDSALTTPNTNPVILDSAGSDGNVFLNPAVAAYKVVLEDANGNLIWTADPVYPAASANVTGTIWGGTSTGSANGQIVSAPGFSQTNGQTVAFIAGFTNTGPLTINAGFGPLPVYQANSSGPTLLVGGEVVTGNIVTVVYSSVLNSGAGGGQIVSSVFFGATIINSPINMSLSSSVASNALTINVLGAFGATAPSPTNPVIIPVRDVTLANGDLTLVTVISPLSIIIPSGATLGAANATAFRIWIVMFNDAGTPRLGVINCVSGIGTGVSIYPLGGASAGPVSAVQITSGSLSSGVIYAPFTVTSKCFAILGYLEYNSSGLAAAGTYTIVPTKLQSFGPNVPLPGQVVQAANLLFGTGGAGAVGAMTLFSNTSATITPTAACNLIKYNISANYSQPAIASFNVQPLGQVFRGASVAPGTPQGAGQAPVSSGTVGVGWQGRMTFINYDFPNTAASVAYGLGAGSNNAGTSVTIGSVSSVIEEIQA